MTLSERLFGSRLLGAALAVFLVASCNTVSTGPGGEITKVKYYFLQPLEVLRTQDPAITFERQHYLFGAYTAAEQIARTGHYYTVMWKADDRTGPVTVRFEYRQANSALTVKKLEKEVENVGKKNNTEFRVIGPEFTTDGRVTAWKATILRGKEELATQQSYLWK